MSTQDRVLEYLQAAPAADWLRSTKVIAEDLGISRTTALRALNKLWDAGTIMSADDGGASGGSGSRSVLWGIRPKAEA